jgi:hypothetical protein
VLETGRGTDTDGQRQTEADRGSGQRGGSSEADRGAVYLSRGRQWERTEGRFICPEAGSVKQERSNVDGQNGQMNRPSVRLASKDGQMNRPSVLTANRPSVRFRLS